jgi:PAS domain S-box-containing protein
MNWSALMFYGYDLRGIALSLVIVFLAWFGARALIRRNHWAESVTEHLSVPFLDQWLKLPALVRYLVGVCVFEGFYYLAFAGGRAFTRPLSAPLWFPDTVLLCALLLTPARNWWIFLLATFPVRLLTVWRPEHLLWTMAPSYANDCLKALLGAVLLRRFVPNLARLGNLRPFALYLVITVVTVPALSALSGAAEHTFLGERFWIAWVQWFLGNSLVNLVVTTAVLYWLFDGYKELRSRSPWRYLEVAFLGAFLIVVAVKAFAKANTSSPAMIYAPAPLLLWAAVRFGPRGAATALSVLAFIAIRAAAQGHGPFATHSPAHNILAIQLFLFVVGVPIFFLAFLLKERQRVERSLRESEERFAIFMDCLPAFAWIKDLQGRNIYLNKMMRDLPQYRGHWAGKTDYEFWPAEIAERFEAKDKKVIATKKAISEVENYVVNGQTLHVLVSKFPILNQAGEVVMVGGASVDITERIEAEKARAHLAAIVESSQDAIIGSNLQRTITSWNKGAEINYGYTSAEAVGQPVSILIPPDRKDEVAGMFERLKRGEVIRQFETKRLRKDGSLIDLSLTLSPIRNGQGEIIGTSAIAHDITDRIANERALRESEERFRFLAEVTNDAIWDWDLVTNQLWWNEGFETLFGYGRDEIEKTVESRSNRIHPAELARVLSGLHRVIDEGGTTWSDEYRFLCKDGSYAYVLDRGQVIRNPDGKGVRMVGGMRDLTERNLAAAAVQALPAELLRAQDEERRRIARELHDSTAQVLAVVSMNLGRLEEWMEGKDPWAENLLADSLAVLTQGNRDLRTLAHLLHPPMLEELGLLGALRDYVEGFSARSGIQVELEFTEDFERCSPEIETALFRVVQESLSNVHRHSASEVALVKLIRNGDLIELTIGDRGKGLPRGLLLGTAETARVGVGISGMRQRIIQLQGHLEIISDEDGTTVCAVLPCSLNRECASEPSK